MSFLNDEMPKKKERLFDISKLPRLMRSMLVAGTTSRVGDMGKRACLGKNQAQQQLCYARP